MKEILVKAGLNLANCVCFGTDGTSSMMSKEKGAVTYLKLESPFAINIACICHEEASGIGEVIDDNAAYLDNLLTRINAYFAHSSVKHALFEIMKTAKGNKDLTSIKRIHDIQWL